MNYTFNKLANGNVEVFQNGQRISTGTAQYATQQYGYGSPPVATPLPGATQTGSTATQQLQSAFGQSGQLTPQQQQAISQAQIAFTPQQQVSQDPAKDAMINNISKQLGVDRAQLESSGILNYILGQQQNNPQLIAMQESLSRLQNAYDTYSKQYSTDSTELTNLKQMIGKQQQALMDLTPAKYLTSQPGLQGIGVSQSFLERRVAQEREPMADALSKLLMSQSFLGEEEEKRRKQAQSQIEGARDMFGLQKDLYSLQRQQIPEGVRSNILNRFLFPESQYSGDVGQYQQALKSGAIPAGSTYQQFQQMGTTPSYQQVTSPSGALGTFNPKTGAYSFAGGGQPIPTSPEATSVLNTVNGIVFGSKDARTSAVANVNRLIQAGDIQGAKDVASGYVYQNMPAAQQAKYDMQSESLAGFEQALSALTAPGALIGPYKNLFESAKPWTLIERDPQFANLKSWIGTATQPIRKANFGVALTENELRVADSFLINPGKDDMVSSLTKIKNLVGFYTWANDAMIARNSGQTKPDLNNYIKEPLSNKDAAIEYNAYLEGQSKATSTKTTTPSAGFFPGLSNYENPFKGLFNLFK